MAFVPYLMNVSSLLCMHENTFTHLLLMDIELGSHTKLHLRTRFNSIRTPCKAFVLVMFISKYAAVDLTISTLSAKTRGQF